jgi:hypothetical protein
MRPQLSIVVLLCGAIAACTGSPAPPEAPAQPAQDPAATASITGRVVFDGEVVPARRIRLDADPQCVSLADGEVRRAEDLLVGEANGTQDVFVYVKQGLSGITYPAPPDPVVLDQQKCRYVPRVFGIQMDQSLTIRNSDPLLHTVRAEAAVNARFNVATPVRGMEVSRTFRATEVMVPITCDMHPWMRAYVGVLDHPFFDVTDQSGQFSISGLPPGSYVIEVWHERLGTQTREVHLSVGEVEALTIAYSPS